MAPIPVVCFFELVPYGRDGRVSPTPHVVHRSGREPDHQLTLSDSFLKERRVYDRPLGVRLGVFSPDLTFQGLRLNHPRGLCTAFYPLKLQQLLLYPMYSEGRVLFVARNLRMEQLNPVTK